MCPLKSVFIHCLIKKQISVACFFVFCAKLADVSRLNWDCERGKYNLADISVLRNIFFDELFQM